MSKIMKIDISKVDYSTYKAYLAQLSEVKTKIMQMNRRLTIGRREHSALTKKALEMQQENYRIEKEIEELKSDLVDALPGGL